MGYSLRFEPVRRSTDNNKFLKVEQTEFLKLSLNPEMSRFSNSHAFKRLPDCLHACPSDSWNCHSGWQAVCSTTVPGSLGMRLAFTLYLQSPCEDSLSKRLKALIVAGRYALPGRFVLAWYHIEL